MESIKLPSCWTQEYRIEDSISVLADLARFASSRSGRFSSIFSSCLDRCILANNFGELVQLEVDYNVLDRPDELFYARQALGFFTKLETLPCGIDKEAAAFQKFVASEILCKETNARWASFFRPGFVSFGADVESVLFTATRKIARLLGDIPSYSELRFSFGPGANTTVKATRSSPRYKLGADLACSSELFNSVSRLLAEAPAWVAIHAANHVPDEDYVAEVPIRVQPGKLTFVPKSATTFRSIVIEPVLNTFAQKGVGRFLEGKLRSVGVNIKDQTRNQNLAREGSITGHLATLDLSSASDTISKEVVASLLGPEWYSFLARFRTGSVVYKEHHFELEKFSSMGNAFTFPLETLLFWALATATCEYLAVDGAVSVYGDDIIIPSVCVDLLKKVFLATGFQLNDKKSFVDGPFRESCGTDWFLGFDIRPYYQKKMVSAATLFALHNRLMRGFDFEFAELVRSYIHPSLHIFGPDGYGDGHLIGAYSPTSKPAHMSRGWCGSVFDTFVLKAKRRVGGILPGDRVLPVYSIYVLDDDAQTNEQAPVDHFVVRGSSGYKRISIYTLRQGIFL